MDKLTITIYPHRSKRKELLSACHMIAGQTLDEPGCMDCRVLPGSEESSAIFFWQHWRDQSLLDNYFRSDHFSALLGAIKLLAIDYELTINDGSPSEGAFIVDRARSID